MPGRFSTYDGGNDSMTDRVTRIDKAFLGDARQVLSGAHLLGSDDVMLIVSASAVDIAIDDAAAESSGASPGRRAAKTRSPA